MSKEFDLVISQYAGFVGQAAKPYLKKGGLLVCNDSHADASMASIDPDFELIAIYRRKADDKFSISDKNLGEYLKPKKGTHPTKSSYWNREGNCIHQKSLRIHLQEGKRLKESSFSSEKNDIPV